MNTLCPNEPRLRTLADLRAFTASKFFQNEFLAFLDALCARIRGVARNARENPSAAPIICAFQKVLARINEIALSIPLESRCAHRFGNPAFRRFVSAVEETATIFVESLTGSQTALDLAPMALYLIRSFGNPDRLDYGTGHELNFFACIFCFQRAGLLPAELYPAVVNSVLWDYFAVARSVIQRFSLEPAGSRGVWGIDDYQFLPFLLGAAQLEGQRTLLPRDCTSAGGAKALKDTWLFCNVISAITSQKTGTCGEFSAYLSFIQSKVCEWAKVHGGLRKMYEMEILNKFVVMKHFPLSVYIPFERERKEVPRRRVSMTCAREIGTSDIEVQHEQLSSD